MKNKKLDILYEDEKVIVVNKKPNILCIGTDFDKINTLYHEVSNYVKKQNKNNKIFVVHRLDKKTSGIVIFAKAYKVKLELQKIFEEGQLVRKYCLLTSELPINKEGEIVMYLITDKFGNVFESSFKNKFAKKAITRYKFEKKVGLYYYFDVLILTGRKNQIRLAFNKINCPIVGDDKFSKIKSKIMYLKAYYLDLSKYDSRYVFQINKEF